MLKAFILYGDNSTTTSTSSTTTSTTTFGGVVSNSKNIQVASFSQDGGYWMAGELTPRRTGINRWTYLCRRAEDHMTGGEVWAAHYYEDSNTWSAPFLVMAPVTKQNDDVAVGMLDDDTIIASWGYTDHGITNWDMHPNYYEIDPDDITVIGGPDPVTGTAGVPQMQYEWIFGQIITDETTPWKLYSSLIQIDVEGGSNEKRVSLLKSIDNGVSWTRYTIETQTAVQISETIVLPLGSNKVMALVRLDQGGTWRAWRSTDDGQTWSFSGNCNLGYGTTQPKVTKAYRNDDGTWDFIVQDRDTGFIIVSRNNDIANDNTMFTTAQFNLPELYYYNWTGDSHRGLGYASQADLGGGVRLTMWAREHSSNTYSEIMFTRDDDIDVAPPIAPPDINFSFTTNTSVLVTIDGYSAEEIRAWNTRYYQMDVSVESDFSTFVSARYLPSVGTVSLNNIRLISRFINLDQLTPGTVYYVRIRAVNQLGASAYTTASFSTTVTIPATIETKVRDDISDGKPYSGFPQASKLANGAIFSIYKRAVDHAASGDLAFSKSIDGGATWTHGVVNIGGVNQLCSAVIMEVLSTGRIFVVYQDNDGNDQNSYTSLKITYSDDNGQNWVQGDSWVFDTDPTPTYLTSILGRPLELPSGKILIHYYQYPSPANAPGGTPSINAILETTDGGDTLTQGPTIITQAGAPFPNGWVSEMGWAITHNTGVDATCKIVGLLRNEEYSYFTHVRSADGGQTWTEDTTNLMYDLVANGRFPCEIIKYNGLMYIVAGTRQLSGGFTGEIAYTTCTPDDLFENDQAGYSAKVVMPYVANANTLGSGEGISWGYASVFIDHHGELICHFYDSSDLSVGWTTDMRHMIYQLPLTS